CLSVLLLTALSEVYTLSLHDALPISAVEVSGLVKRYGSTVAVNGLDLRMDRGSVLALLGPNGAGKTTTVELCEGFLRPDGGTVRDRKSTRLNSSHEWISYAVFCVKKK